MPTKIRGKKQSSRSVKDPVCGAQVDPKTAIRDEEQGSEYYFCSEECRQKFNDSPSDFTAA